MSRSTTVCGGPRRTCGPRDPDDPKATAAQRAPLETRLDEVLAEKKAEGVAQKLVTDQGRGTVQAAVQRDRMAVGYARAAALGACAFCRLLAARGMVFKQDTADFRAHDGCNCGVIPVFRGQRFELSAHAQEWDRSHRERAHIRVISCAGSGVRLPSTAEAAAH
ncbi:hypothetical protein SBADM41S_00454 [Streptomyces badius]